MTNDDLKIGLFNLSENIEITNACGINKVSCTEGVLERVGEGRIMLELIKKMKINCLGHWPRRNCLLKDALEGLVNGKKVRSRRRYVIDKNLINGLHADTKRKAEKRVERRMLSLQ